MKNSKEYLERKFVEQAAALIKYVHTIKMDALLLGKKAKPERLMLYAQPFYTIAALLHNDFGMEKERFDELVEIGKQALIFAVSSNLTEKKLPQPLVDYFDNAEKDKLYEAEMKFFDHTYSNSLRLPLRLEHLSGAVDMYLQIHFD